jgi:uncharacterized protein (TIGR00255 family)
MTGFGSAVVDEFKVEVRSLNHKYLDISVRMPSFLIEHEIPVRNLVKANFERGKIDVNIFLTDKRQAGIRINKELAKEIHEAFSELKRDLSMPGSLDINFFSGYRELLLSEEPQYKTDTLYEAVNAALSKVEEMRKNEGESLGKELAERLNNLEKIHAKIEESAKDVAHNCKDKLLKKIAELVPDLSVDEAKLSQEVAFLAQKSDITEELARLKSHMQQFSSSLSLDSAGRRLDFLLQEMNREANTIASKVDEVQIINMTIEIKTEIERLREQVQNIQ